MRKEAAARGLDPDKWFNHVEVVTAEKIGIETTTYVRNIYKYYASYGLLVQSEEARRAARDHASVQRNSAELPPHRIQRGSCRLRPDRHRGGAARP